MANKASARRELIPAALRVGVAGAEFSKPQLWIQILSPSHSTGSNRVFRILQITTDSTYPGCAGDSFNRDPEETAAENDTKTNESVQQSPAGSAFEWKQHVQTRWEATNATQRPATRSPPEAAVQAS